MRISDWSSDVCSSDLPSEDLDNAESRDNGTASSHSGSRPVEDELPVRPIRVLIVDDHIVMRQGLAALLELEADLQVIGEASDGREAIDKARELRPDRKSTRLNSSH